MIVNADTAYSIEDIIGNTVLSKDGNISKVYLMQMPEKYSLSASDFDKNHSKFLTAFRTMPVNSFVHKQDIGIVKYYDSSYMPENNMLQKAYKNYVSGKKYLEHRVLLIFTLSGLEMLEPKVVKNPNGYNEKYNKADNNRIQSFEESVKSAVNIINQTKIEVTPFEEMELRLFIKDYCNGFTSTNTDVNFNDKDAKMKILNNKYEILTIPRQEYLPEEITNTVEDFSDQDYVFYKGFLDDFGETFCYNHVFNQLIFFKGHSKIKAEIEDAHLKHNQNKGWSKSVEYNAEKLEKALDKINEQTTNILVEANINLIIWSDDEYELNSAIERANTIFNTYGIEHYRATNATLQNLYLSSIIGRNSLMSKDFLFEQPLGQVLCLFTNTTNYISDDTGVYYNDRIYNIPVKRDLWDINKNRINARNSIKIAPTGNGKSFSMLWEIFQELMSGIIVCLIEIGSSADILAKYFKEESVQIKYDYNTPLGINPFKLKPGEEIDNRKIMHLSNLCFKFWQKKEFKDDTDFAKAMRKLIKHYYSVVDTNHSFPSFYNYVKVNRHTILNDLEIKESFFDIDSFIHICDDFIEGGAYENVCKETGIPLEELIENKLFIHIELSKIKEDPFLLSIMLHMINYVIDTKILSDRTKRAKIKFDEFAETQELKSTFSDDHVLASTAFLFQKIRKENGGVDIVIQSPTQIPNNHYFKNIIANHQVLHVLQGSKLVYEATKDILKLEEHDLYLMKSIQNNFNSENPYSEEFLNIGGKYKNIVRLEVPKEIYYAFQTEGNDWAWMQNDFKKTNDMEKTIINIIKHKDEKLSIY